MVLKVHLQTIEPRTVTVGGMEVSRQDSTKAWQESPKGWMYDADLRTAWVKFPDEEAGVKVILFP